MKVLFPLLVVAFVVVHAKKELQGTDCGGDHAIVTLGSITDKKEKGAVDKDSTLKVVFSASKDTHKNDPFDIDLYIEIRKKIGFWYAKMPQSLMDKIGKKIKDKDTKYMGKSVFRIRCLFMNLYRSCLPPKGPHVEKIVMKPLLDELKGLGSVIRWFGSGWYKIHAQGTVTNNKENAFCINLQFYISL